MIQIGRKEYGISNFAIRLLGVITMIMAGVGYMKGYGYDWLEAFGWTSFTFFAFLLAEGVYHTTNKRLYLRRFVVFTLISEIAYTYYRTKTFAFWNPKFFSAMSTLFLGFLVTIFVSYLKKRFDNMVLDMIALAVCGSIAYIIAERYNFDFGGYGILIILGFYVAKNVTYQKITQTVVLLYISFFITSNVLTYVNVAGIQYPIAPELFSMAALPFIWLYDDTRGPNSIAVQFIQYSAYPVFVLVLIILKFFR